MTAAAERVRGFRRGLAVDVVAALNLVGTLVTFLPPAFLVPAAVAVGYDEPPWPFLAAALATLAVGLGLARATRRGGRVGAREGYLVVALVWLLVAALGALPYIFARGQLESPLDAYFESMSGFTTTGATVVADIEGLEHSIAVWRQLTVWLGGLGIVVLALAVLPRLRVGGRQLLEAEAASSPEAGTLTESIRSTSRRFLGLYLALTAVGITTLVAFGLVGLDERMTPYNAVSHALSISATGGFSPEGRSIEGFSAASHWAIALFMFLAGANYALLYRAFVRRRPSALVRDDEFRLYVLVLALGSLLLLTELLAEGIASGEAAVRHAVFQAVSIMTTTGYASLDFNQWTALTSVTIVALMFVGGSAGSTTGSIKVVRHLLMGRMLVRELNQTVHPELISPVRLNGSAIEDRTLRSLIVFVFLYLGCFGLGALGIAIEGAHGDTGITPFQAIAAAATTIGNVGPGFGIAGPMGSFAEYTGTSKAIMIALMWLGRLEIVPIVVLFTRRYWRA